MNTEQTPADEPDVDEPDTDTDDTDDEDVEPAAEPDDDPADSHTGPLDDDDDARFLDERDPRRQEVEAKLGKRFADEPTVSGR